MRKITIVADEIQFCVDFSERRCADAITNNSWKLIFETYKLLFVKTTDLRIKIKLIKG